MYFKDAFYSTNKDIRGSILSFVRETERPNTVSEKEIKVQEIKRIIEKWGNQTSEAT
jgi:hypothetical protein